MAIDTAEKRGAALRFGFGRTRVPDASAGAFDRGAELGHYFIVAVVVPPVSDDYGETIRGMIYHDGTVFATISQDGTRLGAISQDGIRSGIIHQDGTELGTIHHNGTIRGAVK